MAFPQKRWFAIPKKVAHVKAVLLMHNSWEFHCGHIFPNGIFYCKKRHFPGPLVLLHLHRGWVKNFVVKVTLFLLALVNVWNFTQAKLRGDDRMMNVFGRDKLLSNYWVWKLPLFQAVFFCSWKFTAKLKKSTTPLGGFRCCRYQGGGFPIFLFRSLILPSYLRTCPMLCFSNGIHFHPQWVGKLCMWVEKIPAAKRPQVAAPPKLRLAGQVQWRKELILKSSCVMVCPSGKLGSRLTREVLPQGLTNKFRCFFEQERLKEVAICWCCWWSLLNMTDSFFSHRPVLLRS